MSSYYVFEGYSNKTYDMKNITSFSNGLLMPWNYYTIELNIDNNKPDDKDSGRFGIYKIIFTSECISSDMNDRKTSEISRYYPSNTGPIKESIKNPEIDDYEKWGWTLEIDPITKEKKIPTFGSWTFKKEVKIDYEENAYFDLIFNFGFGLNKICYNYSKVISRVNIFNLTVPLDVYCSKNKQLVLKYDENKDNFGNELKLNKENKIICNIEQGNPLIKSSSILHLYIQVEQGEHLEIDVSPNTVPYTNEVEIKCSYYNESHNWTEHKFREAGKVLSDGTVDSNDKKLTLQFPEFKDVQVKKLLNNIESLASYDFYYLQVYTSPAYIDNITTSQQLRICLNISPKSNGKKISETFNKTLEICMNIKKSPQIPKIISNTGTNLRSRIILDVDEAINMAINTNNKDTPTFIKENSLEQALIDIAGFQDERGLKIAIL
jgi:hypothetical protein